MDGKEAQFSANIYAQVEVKKKKIESFNVQKHSNKVLFSVSMKHIKEAC